MDFSVLEERIKLIEDTQFYHILELIIEAVRYYPKFGLKDTDAYFDEIKAILKTDVISVELINQFKSNSNFEKIENAIWLSDSLGSLYEAFYLMNLYKISFEEVQQKIIQLSKHG